MQFQPPKNFNQKYIISMNKKAMSTMEKKIKKFCISETLFYACQKSFAVFQTFGWFSKILVQLKIWSILSLNSENVTGAGPKDKLL